MRVLFVSGELIAGDLACRLAREGCEVRLFIEDESRKDCLDGMVDKTEDWRNELSWVGKDGLIVFDDVGYGKIQDELRKDGYSVVGGSEGGDILEKERGYAQKILSICDVSPLPTHDFQSVESAIHFMKKQKGAWVVKQNGHASALTYVGTMQDGSDSLEVLESYENHTDISSISLQKKVDGVEIAAARYFNGNDWVGPIEMNVEHKRMCNGDIGPLTGEMGTLTWYDDNEDNRLFQATLARLKPFLTKKKFRGDIDVNCIVNEKEVYPLEVTTRFGCPAVQLQAELHLSPWKEFLLAVAKGEQYDVEYKKNGYGLVVSVAIPPFPYKAISSDYYLKGARILFRSHLTKEEQNRLHFEEVSLRKSKDGKDHYSIAGSNGYTLYVTGFGKTIPGAREQVYSLIDKIVIPKMFYRTDIGLKFLSSDEKNLKKWGWL